MHDNIILVTGSNQNRVKGTQFSLYINLFLIINPKTFILRKE